MYIDRATAGRGLSGWTRLYWTYVGKYVYIYVPLPGGYQHLDNCLIFSNILQNTNKKESYLIGKVCVPVCRSCEPPA